MELMEDGTTIEQQMFAMAAEKKVPLYGVLELLPLCNLNCDMCYVRMNREEMEDMTEELIDRFGDIPKKVEKLLEVEALKAQAHQLYVTAVEQKGEVYTFTMYEKAKVHPERIPKEICDLYKCEPALPMEESSRKITPPAKGTGITPIQVHRYDIDSNNHVNNERYVPMAMECQPEGAQIRQLRVENRNSAV